MIKRKRKPKIRYWLYAFEPDPGDRLVWELEVPKEAVLKILKGYDPTYNYPVTNNEAAQLVPGLFIGLGAAGWENLEYFVGSTQDS